jgi:DNA-binding SARP family transcriptional activator
VTPEDPAAGRDVRGEGAPRTRLRPPRLPPGCLPRRDLVERVGRRLRRGPVLVVAAPGYGKSTLMAQVARETDRPCVWCSCALRPGTLLRGLIAGLAERAPGIGAGLDPAGPPEEVVADLCGEVLDAFPDGLGVTLDDVHLLAGTQDEAALRALVAELPHVADLALLARRPPPLALPPQALVVSEGDLALSAAESGELLAELGLELARGDLQELHRRTEGWITGLLLALQSGGLVPDERGGTAEARLFAYLEAEVLAGLGPEEGDFLLATAVLDRVTPALAAAVTGRADAGTLLERLVEGHRLTFRVPGPGGWYRHHHLLLALLRHRLEGRGRPALAEGHRRAARALLEAGEPDEAVRHYLTAGDLGAAVSALEPMGRSPLGPDGGALGGWLDAIPAELWSDSPGLLLAHASLLFGRAEYEAAFDALERALDDLLRAGERERAAVALVRLLRAIALAGGFEARGIEIARRALPRVDRSDPAALAARVMLGSLLGRSGRHAEAEEELAAAVELHGAQGVMAAFAQATRAFDVDHPQGRSRAALVALDGAIAELERLGPQDDLHVLAFARVYRAVVLGDLGRDEDALAESDRVADLARRRGLGRVALPVVGFLRAGALAALGRWEQLDVELARSAPVHDRLRGALGGYRGTAAAARLAAHRHDRAALREAVETTREALARHAQPFERSLILADVARAAWEAGEASLARELVEEARAAALAASSPWARARAALVGAAVWGPGERGDALLAQALDLSERPGFEALWTRKERPLAAEALARALRGHLGPPGLAARLVALCGGEVLERAAGLLDDAPAEVRRELAGALGRAVAADRTLGRLLRDPDPGVRREAGRARRGMAPPRSRLRFLTLGGFSILRDGSPVSDATFGRQKARQLLAMLLCARGPVHRDALAEALWPALPGERAAAALHSTLYALRRALEPSLPARAASSLVVADSGLYRLALRREDEVDALRFLDLVREAGGAGSPEAELEALRAAEALHQGAFLPEWRYAQWTEPLRTEIQEAHQDVLVRLAEGLASSGQPAAAVARYRLLLAEEPEREGWHRALMRLYAEAGERALALRQFHLCRSVLLDRLGVEPSRATRELYTHLLSDEPGPGA